MREEPVMSAAQDGLQYETTMKLCFYHFISYPPFRLFSCRHFCCRIFIACFILLSFLIPVSAFADETEYLKNIKPLLRERCYACHGALKQEGGLRLDTVASAIQGGDSGAAIRKGNTEASLLLKRVTATDESERMPPIHEGETLPSEQITLLKDWIAAGANGPMDEQPETDPDKHWAFQTIARPTVPETESSWVRNPIDAYLHQQHLEQGIEPQPEASRIVLLRRLYLDLIGIPPTWEEIEACEADTSSQWYERTVQRLLNDPRHGERWARHWMDVWRYSDWWGLGDQLRNSQKHIWHWRDWIVESLNADTPYDEMIRLMLAADEQHPNDLGKLRATGYLARNYWLFNRPQWMEETVEHVSKGFLGLTMNCSRCHDHKYDPLEQTDYYRFRAFFEPYHVRLDQVPDETDLAQDGIPRVFDGLLNEPTYLYIRGDERTPDKTKIITPGVPKVLNLGELKIESVSLPVEAWQPERRPWVLDSFLAASRKRVTEAGIELQTAKEKIAAVEKNREEKEIKPEIRAELNQQPASMPILRDSFVTFDATRWQTLGGDWVHEQGRLEQKLDGATRSALKLLDNVPRNFDATIRFTTLGGSKWRSVGLSFDVAQQDPMRPTADAENDINVYVSAFTDGSKVQASFIRDGKWQYPAGNAVRSMPIQLNQEYSLRVQVRDNLLNASLNDEPLIAWEIPVPRRDGSLQVITFDALAVIHEVTIRTLDDSVALLAKDANLAPKVDAAEIAKADVNVALAKLASSQAEMESMERRAEAQRAEWNESDETLPHLAQAAIRAERLAAIAKEKYNVALAEKTLLGLKAAKRDAAVKKLNGARDTLEKVVKANDAEIQSTDTFTKFSGAAWTPTRFLNSGKDDPTVAFSSTSTGRRTALANWITDRRNPLTARVAVNHIWTRHMGQPLVTTVFDFGLKGTPPTHPQLLDWLASELMDSGWSMRHVHELIVGSAAYRMNSTAKNRDRDPENRYWARRVPIRLESQIVRDSLLAIAGTLDNKIGGPSIPTTQQSESTRRSLYFFHSNNERNLFLTTFDEALVKDCYRREQSIVPQQALALSNSKLALDAAEKIAKKIAMDCTVGENHEITFIRRAFRVVIGIDPNKSEIDASVDAIASWRKMDGNSIESAQTNFVWALINHNDFVTLR